MSRGPISRFPVPERAELPADIAARMDDVENRSGFLPNVFPALAHRPAEWRAFVAYHDALMDKDSAMLTKADRELVVVATSGANDCLYCVVAHGAVARIRSRNPRIADQVALDWRKAELTAAQKVMLEVAVRLATTPAQITESDLDTLRLMGFSDDDVWDIGAIVAFFAMSNRLVHWAAIPPNDEFYLMGRLPR